MSAVEVIARVLETSALDRDMVDVSAGGATASDLRGVESALGRSLSAAHRKLLAKWNGASLDVVRIVGTDAILQGQPSLAGTKIGDGVIVADDPAGFLYVERADGSIWSLDSDGGRTKKLASDLDDFFGRLIFGPDAAKFMGSEWKQTLIEAGVISESPPKRRERRAPVAKKAPPPKRGVSRTKGRTVDDVIDDLAAFVATKDDVENVGRLNDIFDGFGNMEDRERAVPAIFAVIERYPKADLGRPGPLVHELEAIGVYLSELVDSVKRKPTFLTVWMVHRLLNGATEQQWIDGWRKLLHFVTTHPAATPSVRREARESLRAYDEGRED